MTDQGNLVLRHLSLSDAQSIKEWPSYSKEFCPLNYALRSGGWLDAFPESATTIRFGGWLQSDLVGFSILTHRTSNSAEFYIALHPSKTGQGIGRQLTEETLKFAFDKLHLCKVYLKVRKWHTRGIQLYTKVGFVMTGQKTETIQGDPVEFYVMEKVKPG